jgi:DNA repair photolyase
MREDQPPSTRQGSRPVPREERLAAKLRENLQRRKQQTREIARKSDTDPSQEAE